MTSPFFSSQMTDEEWTTSYCLDMLGFPKLLYATMTRLGILDHPEYVGREYEEHGTQRCEVIVYVRASKDFPDIMPWVVSTTGFWFEDTYQVVARKALRYLCQIYERQISRTPMRFFPPLVKSSPVWVARMSTLEGPELQEGDPTTVFMFDYLLSLDKQYDRHAKHLRKCIRRAQKAEKQIRSLEVQLAEAKEQAARAESREAIAIEALKQAEDRHTQQLIFLVTRAKRRSLTLQERECPILDGMPIGTMEEIQAMIVDVPPTPPPTGASRVISEIGSDDGEEIPPLTQPPPEDGACHDAVLPKDSSSSEDEEEIPPLTQPPLEDGARHDAILPKDSSSFEA